MEDCHRSFSEQIEWNISKAGSLFHTKILIRTDVWVEFDDDRYSHWLAESFALNFSAVHENNQDKHEFLRHYLSEEILGIEYWSFRSDGGR